MPSATLPSLSKEEIDDLIYFARIGDLSELLSCIEGLAKSATTTQSSIISAAIDEQSGNGILHMASANDHIETIKHVIAQYTFPPSNSQKTLLNGRNSSGNTPLHWASLNGHLEAVKLLVGAGADPAITNNAGHDVVYEAEINGKDTVVEWLLTEGRGLETGIKGGHEGPSAEDIMQEQSDTAGVEEDLEHVSFRDAS